MGCDEPKKGSKFIQIIPPDSALTDRERDDPNLDFNFLNQQELALLDSIQKLNPKKSARKCGSQQSSILGSQIFNRRNSGSPAGTLSSNS